MKEVLSPKTSDRFFFRLNLNRRETLVKGNFYIHIRDINTTWADIEYLTYVFYTLSNKVPESKDGKRMLFHSMVTISTTYYVYLDVIRTLFYNSIYKLMPGNLKSTIRSDRRFWDKIAVARNNIFIHKDKRDFIRPYMFEYGTDAYGRFYYSVKYKENNKEEKSLDLYPLEDAARVMSILKNFEGIFNGSTSP